MSTARTIEERVVIVRLFSKYENPHELQRQWKHHFSTSPPALATITAVSQRFNKTESVEDLPLTGPPATTLTKEGFKTWWIPIHGYRFDKTRFKYKSISCYYAEIAIRIQPHPKFYFCLRTSNLNETFRLDVSWTGNLLVKIAA